MNSRTVLPQLAWQLEGKVRMHGLAKIVDGKHKVDLLPAVQQSNADAESCQVHSLGQDDRRATQVQA